MSKVERNRIHKRRKGGAYAWPMGAWFTIFFTFPLAIIVLYSFLKKGLYGGVEYQFTLDAYRQLVNSAFWKVLLRTFEISVISTALILLLSLPCAYAMARSRHQTLLLMLIMIPFWTNSLIRVYAWISVLSAEGFLNHLLMKIGLINEPLQMMYCNKAVILVLIYMYIPFAILPLFTTMDRFDFSLLDAARDLGATKIQAVTKVLLPGIRNGIYTALIFTFIPIFGAYTVPLLVGGQESYMLGNVLVDQVNINRNLPLASAFSLLLTIFSLIALFRSMENNHKGGR